MACHYKAGLANTIDVSGGAEAQIAQVGDLHKLINPAIYRLTS